MHVYAGRQCVPFLWLSLVWPGREANSRPTVREADTLPTEPTRQGALSMASKVNLGRGSSQGEIFKKWDEPFKKISLRGFYIFGIFRISRFHFCMITFHKGGGIFKICIFPKWRPRLSMHRNVGILQHVHTYHYKFFVKLITVHEGIDT